MAKRAAKPADQKAVEGTTPDPAPPASKSAAARAALEAGQENPTRAVEFIKNTYGIEMTPEHFSAVKSQEKKKEEGTAPPKGKPGRKPKTAVEGIFIPSPKPRGGGDLLDALTTMKPLIAQFGAEKVKKMVDLLG